MVMRVVFGFVVLMCLAVAVGSGVYLALEEQRQIMSYSATTIATVFEERLERHERPNAHVHRPRHVDSGSSRFSYEPVVRYRCCRCSRWPTTWATSCGDSPYEIGSAHSDLGDIAVGLTGDLEAARKHYEEARKWRAREGREERPLDEWWPKENFDKLK
jgi:hypothetical protein